MPKYFTSLSFSQLFFKDRVFSTRSQCLCSKHISDSSKSSQSQIDFFFLAFFSFHFGHQQSQQSNHDFPSQQGAYHGCVVALLGGELSSKVDFSKFQGEDLQSFPRAPGQVKQNQEGFPLITHLRSFVVKCFVQCIILLILAPCVLASLVMFWV